MTWLAPKLNRRVTLQQPIQDPDNFTGGYDRDYADLITVWMGVKPFGIKNMNAAYVRGVQIETIPTHTFIVRFNSVSNLGKAFTKGFDDSYDSIADLIPVKKDIFLYLKGGVTKGRRFKTLNANLVDERTEYMEILVQEIEEVGTGYPE